MSRRINRDRLRAGIWNALVAPANHDTAALDGVRAIAVALVVVVHLCYLVQHDNPGSEASALLSATGRLWGMGGTGVQLFFVLSGFLMVRPYVSGRGPQAGDFYIRRCLRILPAYFMSLAVVVALVQHQYVTAFGAHWLDLALHVTLTHNLLTSTSGSINGPYWTLPVEWDFYALLPLAAPAFAAFALHRGAARAGSIVLLASILCSALAATAVAEIQHRFPSLAEFTTAIQVLQFAPLFAAGAAVAAATSEPGVRAAVSRRPVLALASAVGVVVIAVNVLAPEGRVLGFASYYFFQSQMAIAYGALVLLALVGGRVFTTALSAPWLRFVGNISFSVYLYHWPVLANGVVPLASRFGRGAAPIVVATLLTVIVLPVVGSLSYLVVERPALTFATDLVRRRRSRIAPEPAAG